MGLALIAFLITLALPAVVLPLAVAAEYCSPRRVLVWAMAVAAGLLSVAVLPAYSATLERVIRAHGLTMGS